MTAPVKRYDCQRNSDVYDRPTAEMVEYAKGDYVLASDYDALTAANARLRALLVRARPYMLELTDIEAVGDWLVDIEKELAHGE